jgi:hypothetical protein
MRFLYRTRGPGNVREGVSGRGLKVSTGFFFLYTRTYTCTERETERKEEKIILFLLVYVITEDAEI